MSLKSLKSRIDVDPVIAFLALAICVHMAFVGPITAAAGNSTILGEHSSPFSLEGLLVGLSMAALIVLTSLLRSNRIGFAAFAICVWTAIFIILGFQFSLFVSDQPLDGQTLVWSPWRAVVEYAVYAVGLFVFLIIPGTVRYAALLAFSAYVALNALILIPSLGPASAPSQAASSANPLAPFFRSHPDQLPEIDTYSAQYNVVIILIDTLQNDLAEQLLNSFPSARETVSEFTFFRNAAGAYPYTSLAVPYIFSGIRYSPGSPLADHLKASYDQRMDHILAQRGFGTSYLSLFDRAAYSFGNEFAASQRERLLHRLMWYRYLPTFWKIQFFDVNTDFVGVQENKGDGGDIFADVSVLEQLAQHAKLGAQRPQFKFIHLWGVHLPTRMASTCEPIPSAIDRSLAVGQAACIFSKIGTYFAALKSIGAFDASEIFIIADHGTRNFAIDGDYTDTPVSWEVRASAHPTMLHKAAGARGPLKYSDAPVMLGDIRDKILAPTDPDQRVRDVPLEQVTRTTREFLFYPAATQAAQETLGESAAFEISGNIRERNSWRPVELPARQ